MKLIRENSFRARDLAVRVLSVCSANRKPHHPGKPRVMRGNSIPALGGCLAAVLLASCTIEHHMSHNTASNPPDPEAVLFEDAMAEGWQENWTASGSGMRMKKP